MDFKLNNKANAGGTSLQGYATASPADVIKLFGEAEDGDGYKVSHEWTFQAVEKPNVIFTLYNWKNTNLYDGGFGVSPKEFGESTTPYEFHIGSTRENYAQYEDDFKAWLLKVSIKALPDLFKKYRYISFT